MTDNELAGQLDSQAASQPASQPASRQNDEAAAAATLIRLRRVDKEFFFGKGVVSKPYAYNVKLFGL